MPQLRFATARSLLDAFPELTARLAVAPSDESPIAYLNRLSSQDRLEDAVLFCAHLLPRREAVWWACGSLKQLLREVACDQSEGFRVAEAWVYEPSEDNRRKALETGMKGDSADPSTWLSLGAGWSGGMLSSHPKGPVPMPPHMTARAARIAITLGAHRAPEAERAERLRACVTDGTTLAENGL
ncbi:MAG TPA: hypothetical protein VHA77_05465 [Xanthobacteraceae bacterium]|jgi:hypothetical protein|nr:hypothetical protein [Xanthobacteraceae bacterium]